VVMSSTRQATNHPAYVELLTMGTNVIPLVLARLKHTRSRPVWLRLLGSLTTFQPGAGEQSITDAAAAWMRWAKRSGYSA
jgi:hypothetical protein